MGARRQRIRAAVNDGKPAAWIQRKLKATLEEIYKVGCVHRWVESPIHPVVSCCLCDANGDIMGRRSVGVNTEEIHIRITSKVPLGVHLQVWAIPWKRK